jgi:hypothetical protein
VRPPHRPHVAPIVERLVADALACRQIPQVPPRKIQRPILVQVTHDRDLDRRRRAYLAQPRLGRRGGQAIHLLALQRVQPRLVLRIQRLREHLLKYTLRVELPARDRLRLRLLPLLERRGLNYGVGQEQVRELHPAVDLLRRAADQEREGIRPGSRLRTGLFPRHQVADIRR